MHQLHKSNSLVTRHFTSIERLSNAYSSLKLVGGVFFHWRSVAASHKKPSSTSHSHRHHNSSKGRDGLLDVSHASSVHSAAELSPLSVSVPPTPENDTPSRQQVCVCVFLNSSLDFTSHVMYDMIDPGIGLACTTPELKRSY